MKNDHDANRLTRFLLPIDKDGPLYLIASTAGAMAWVLGQYVEKIALLHVMAGRHLRTRLMNIDYRVDFVLESRVIKELRDRYLEKEIKPLLEQVAHELEGFDIKAPLEWRIEDGDPVEMIKSICEKEGFSTIIMARRGLTPLKQILLGSVSAGVIHRTAKASIYLVGQEPMPKGRCPVARTLIALDGSDNAYAAVKEASILYRACADSIELIKLLTVIDLTHYSRAVAGGRSPEREAELILKESKGILLDQGISEDKIDAQAQYGHPADVITREAEKQDVNMVFMGRTGASGLKNLFVGSVSQGVIQKCFDKTISLVA